VSKVSITRCPSYEQSVLEDAVLSCLAPLGGIQQFVNPGERIFLKLNLIMALPPEKAATTHPQIAAVLTKLLTDVGVHVVIGDCPGHSFTKASLRALYRTCGIESVAEQYAAELNYDMTETTLKVANGSILKSLPVCRAMLECDGIINLPKLKTHGFMTLTAAVKNMFGVIPGLAKADFHLKMPEPGVFGEMLVDIAQAVTPRLSLVDAVVAMEGAGPTRGTPIQTGLVAASADPFALDLVCAQLAGMRPESVMTIQAAARRGLAPRAPGLVQVAGEDPKAFSVRFKLPPIAPPKNPMERYLPHAIARYVFDALRPKPVFITERCNGCGTCAKHCPPQVISMRHNLPQVELRLHPLFLLPGTVPKGRRRNQKTASRTPSVSREAVITNATAILS